MFRTLCLLTAFAPFAKETELGAHNFSRSVKLEDEEDKKGRKRAASKGVREGALFQSSSVDIFHIQFNSDLGDLLGSELQTNSFTGHSEADQWIVDKVVVYKLPPAAASLTAMSQPTGGQCWLFQSRLGGDTGEVGGVSWQHSNPVARRSQTEIR